MAAAPRFKIYNSQGVYVAACKYATEAIVLVAFLGKDATIRDGHGTQHIVWWEGNEQQPASESYDFAAEVIFERITRNVRRMEVL